MARKGNIPWNKGKRGPSPSKETIEKRRVALTGRHHSEEVKRRISESEKGKHVSDESKRKMSLSHIGVQAGTKHPLYGLHHSTETKQKISIAKKGKTPSNKGKPRFDIKGKLNPQWRGGISYEPYCPKFNNEFKERVRAFWRYECGNCGKSQDENSRKLHVHHVNYQKNACCDEEITRWFVPLCDFCHGKSNHNREKWEKKLMHIIEKRHSGRCYFHQKERLVAWGVT